MGVSIGGAKKKFADIVDELHTEPPMMSQFAVWLDLKLAEYKLQGDMRLDFHDCVSAPDWMKGSKCQCLERAQFGLASRNGKNAYMYSGRESAPVPKRGKMPQEANRNVLPMKAEEFDADDMSLEDFDEMEDLESCPPDTAIDSQHPLVQLLSKKSKKKATPSKRGRPKGAKGITITETGVRVKRVPVGMKRKDTGDFSNMSKAQKELKLTPQSGSSDVHSTTSKLEAKADSSLQPKPDSAQMPEPPKAAPVKMPDKFPNHPSRSPSIPDLSDDELLDTFNEHDDDEDDCSFDSITPPLSPEPHLQPRPPNMQGNVRQPFPIKPPERATPTAGPNFRPSFQGNQQGQGYYRGAYPPHQREALSRSQSPHHPIASPHPQSHPSTQQHPNTQQHTASQPGTPSHPPLHTPGHPSSIPLGHPASHPHGHPSAHPPIHPSSHTQGHPPSHLPGHHIAHPSGNPSSQPPQSGQFQAHPNQPQSVSGAGPPFNPQNVSQSGQSPSNPAGPNFRLDRFKTTLTTPQSLLRSSASESSNEALKMGMDFSLDPFNDDFYDDDFGTATDEEDIIALESDEEAQLAMMENESMGSPSDSIPETASLPERLPGSQGPGRPGNQRPVVSDPGTSARLDPLDELAPKKRKYNRKGDDIKVPKDVRLTVHNVVKDLKTQNPTLEWDFTKGMADEWNREMNAKIVALVENRMGEVDVDTCMKAINCYFISRKAQWRKQQTSLVDESKKKTKPASKPESMEATPPPPTE